VILDARSKSRDELRHDFGVESMALFGSGLRERILAGSWPDRFSM
jgi:predicted nucleotidyltransferase